jgi:hypothetical protein
VGGGQGEVEKVDYSAVFGGGKKEEKALNAEFAGTQGTN